MSPADVVALPGWRWRAGALDATHGFRVIDATSDGTLISASIRGSGEVAKFLLGEPVVAASPRERVSTWLPSRDDPATLGCLLALVREAWGASAHARPVPGGWCVEALDDSGECGWPGDVGPLWGPTEWDALVAALAAAPSEAS